MSNLSSLIKIEFSRSLSGLVSRKNAKKRATPTLYILLLLFALFVGISFIYNFAILWMFKTSETPLEQGLILFASLASLLTFVSSINQARSIYIGEDYDMLAVLPIKRRDIIASKIFTMYLLELLFSVIVMVPCGIALIVFTSDISLMFIAFLLAILVPIVPISFASLISLLLTILTARFKYGNFITIFLYGIFIVAMSMMGFFMGRGNAQMFANVGGVVKWFNPLLLLIELSLSDSYLYLLIFVGASIAILIITVLVFASLFSLLHELVSSIKMKNVYVRKELKIKNEFKTLLGIEFKRLFNSKMYFLNGVMGAMMCVLMTILSIISTTPIAADPNAAEYFNILIVPIMIAIMMFILSISNPSCSALSIEGKSFWLAKTLPINMKKYMYAKILVTYIIFIPASMISSTIVVVFYHNDILGCVMAYVIPIIAILLFGVIGLINNVKHPKFKWKNEQEVVKNSVAVTFTMLFGFLISIVLGTVLIVVSIWSTLIAYIVVSIVLIVLFIICLTHLRKIFVSRINAMEDL